MPDCWKSHVMTHMFLPLFPDCTHLIFSICCLPSILPFYVPRYRCCYVHVTEEHYGVNICCILGLQSCFIYKLICELIVLDIFMPICPRQFYIYVHFLQLFISDLNSCVVILWTLLCTQIHLSKCTLAV